MGAVADPVPRHRRGLQGDVDRDRCGVPRLHHGRGVAAARRPAARRGGARLRPAAGVALHPGAAAGRAALARVGAAAGAGAGVAVPGRGRADRVVDGPRLPADRVAVERTRRPDLPRHRPAGAARDTERHRAERRAARGAAALAVGRGRQAAGGLPRRPRMTPSGGHCARTKPGAVTTSWRRGPPRHEVHTPPRHRVAACVPRGVRQAEHLPSARRAPRPARASYVRPIRTPRVLPGTRLLHSHRPHAAHPARPAPPAFALSARRASCPARASRARTVRTPRVLPGPRLLHSALCRPIARPARAGCADRCKLC
ncbi:hypothetical protein FRIGORI9N_500001 [Frigoribacterium sp. 9N]|nr:hypothetical protein FRIGORI9N_500001 [Frigoribacterium sp. 9N]